MIDPRDKNFYNHLSRGVINSMFSNGSWSIADLIFSLPRFLLSIVAIGARMLLRKRQGILEFGDQLRLIAHLALAWLVFHSGIVTSIYYSPAAELAYGGTNFLYLVYLGLIVLAYIYHYRVDFRYPAEGLELRKEYRGRTIFSAAHIDELQDMKLRIYDSLCFALLGFALVRSLSDPSIGYIILFGGIALCGEELLYNDQVNTMRRNMIGAKEYAELLDRMSENKNTKRNSSDSDDEAFDVQPVQ